ncbi:GNAT family N-acetyltransferase [Streptomyces sp. NPDC004732]|uniref:GNAT family N-acetyltransferase n=1 Tax=Streptomyces sp. NPDC004732 TaxID=3154290 RepID=UPI0033B21880
MERSSGERELLALEVDVVHGLGPGEGDGALRVADPSVRAVVAWSPGARVLALGAEGPDVLRAADGFGDLGDMGQAYAPGEPPDVLVRISAACTAAGDRASLRGGPCFTFPERLAADFPSPLPLLLSDAEGRAAARELTRPDNWRPGEWAELISGAAGEWAMAVHDGSPVSICHTPAANARAAEAGIWTRADFRGRGLAPAAVAAWSRRARRDKQVLFYSTTADNHASRSVARTLGLAPLGWIWTVR